jgi:hypothetical protein
MKSVNQRHNQVFAGFIPGEKLDVVPGPGGPPTRASGQANTGVFPNRIILMPAFTRYGYDQVIAGVIAAHYCPWAFSSVVNPKSIMLRIEYGYHLI